MNKRVKTFFVLFLGWLLGVVTCILIPLYSLCRDKGLPLVNPIIYGNIRIYPWNSGDELEHQMGLADWVIVEKDKNCFITINLDKQKQFSGFSFWKNGDSILSYSIPPKHKDQDMVSYGTTEQVLFWMDYNSDGIFDVQSNKENNTRSILIDNEWVQTEAVSKKVIVKNDETETRYDFSREEGKWLPMMENEGISEEGQSLWNQN